VVLLALKEDDFVSLDYVGTVDGKVFDTTKEDIAKKEKIYSEKTKYGPVTIIIGAGQLLRGIDEALVGKGENESFEIELEPEKAFGKKNSKLLKIIPEKVFKAQKIDIYPRAMINFGKLMGYVISVGSGRVIVDFNHPLAGKKLYYSIEIHKRISGKKEQVKSIVEMYSGKNCSVDMSDGRVSILCPKGREIKPESQDMIKKDVKKYVKLADVEFVKEKAGQHDEKSKQSADNRAPAPKNQSKSKFINHEV